MSSTPKTASRSRVLVADDQVDVQEALRLLLKGAGYEVETVGSPGALLAAARERHFDLILLDMNYTRDTTSGAEGLDLLAHLRAMNGPPVIVMTAWSDVELAVEAMRRGASDFVQKPWDNTRVLAAVGKYTPQNEGRGRNDMELAHNIQQRLLPAPGGQIGELEYAGRCIPALAVGGDYFDVIPLDGDHTAFLLADVSGKGMAAALLMSNLQACFRAQAGTALRPTSELLQTVNRLFLRASGPEHFVTLFFGIYQHSTATIEYISCGHHPALLVRADGTTEMLGATATVLGLFDEWKCKADSLSLETGDLILLYSDGVLEHGAEGERQMEPEALLPLLSGHRSDALDRTAEGIVDSVQAISGTVPHDDITILALRRSS